MHAKCQHGYWRCQRVRVKGVLNMLCLWFNYLDLKNVVLLIQFVFCECAFARRCMLNVCRSDEMSLGQASHINPLFDPDKDASCDVYLFSEGYGCRRWRVDHRAGNLCRFTRSTTHLCLCSSVGKEAQQNGCTLLAVSQFSVESQIE